MQATLPVTYEQGDPTADTWTVGGSRFAMWDPSVWLPTAWGQNRESVPLAYPTVPPSWSDMTDQGMGQATGGGMQAAAAAIEHPFSPKHSVLPWLLGAILALALLHWIHWSKRD